ncbi:MAG: T9SS type A sorting domain-containing protein [Dysgonamonadaceae bacterium]|nr:T9SS type A sorting domain-containing protein [Dysgonamonadaceae bacterium]
MYAYDWRTSSVDISSLPNGIYIARLQTGGRQVYVRKFIKI